MDQIIHAYYIYDNEICISPKDLQLNKTEEDTIVYEVIRIINGYPLFIEDHLKRFENSVLAYTQSWHPEKNKIHELILKLIERNSVLTGNMKFLYQLSKNRSPNFIAYFIPHNYPTSIEYQEGINMAIFQAERKNPSVKAEQNELRTKTQSLLKETNIYEILLVHSKHYITEGSKSNFFLIKNKTIYSAPYNEILEGITAKQLIAMCNEMNNPIIEKTTSPEELTTFDAAFITGTSPKILPVKSIDNFKFDVNNSTLREIMTNFDKIIESYLKKQVL